MIRIFMIGYSEEKGGVEAYIKNLDESIDHKKFEVIYAGPDMLIDGKVWMPPKNRHNYLKYCHFWNKFYRENHFDVVYHNTCDVVSIDALRFAKKAGIPVRIIHSHCTDMQQGIEKDISIFHKITEKRNRKILDKFATHLFACSEVAGKWMFDDRPFQVIKNGIEISKYKFNQKNRQNIRKTLGLGNETLVGFVGRFSPQKNPFFAISIVDALTKKYPSVRALFVGEGEQRKDVELDAHKRGLDDKIFFVGEQTNVNEWMSAMDSLFMPSLFEGLPFVLVEAQTSGLHCVVSSNVSPEANITGLVQYVDLNADLDEWADKIFAASSSDRPDTTQKMIDAGYSIEDTAAKVSEIISEALAIKE